MVSSVAFPNPTQSYVSPQLTSSVELDAQGALRDAFGRLRVSEPKTLFNSKLLFDANPFFWDDQQTSGSGTGSSHSVNKAAVTMSVSNATAGTRVRQTFQRFNYESGKSHQIMMTFANIATMTGITKRIGYFDDNNGLFLQSSGGTVSVVQRSKASGSVVDTVAPQSGWNIDRMDGTGPSKLIANWSMAQILMVDFEWLGVGRVRFGLNISGVTYYVHEFLNANNLATVYMSSPNLPLRCSIANSGSGAASTFDVICASVMSEGGSDSVGIARAASLGSSAVNANTIGTVYALLGIRLQAAKIGSLIRPIQRSVMSLTNDTFLWEARFNPTVAGTFTYADYPNSTTQIAFADTVGNPSANTVTGGISLVSGYGRGQTAEMSEIFTSRPLGVSLAGALDTIVLCVTPLTSNLDIIGAVTWRELD